MENGSDAEADVNENEQNESEDTEVFSNENAEGVDDGEPSVVEPLISETIDDFSAPEEGVVSNEDIQQELGDDGTDSMQPGQDEEEDFSDGDVQEEFASGDAELFTSGTSGEISTVLSEYDLIYLNGTLSEASAKLILDSGLPCIINQDKFQGQEREIFSSFVKADDNDGHYVNQYVYFFENTNPGDADVQSDGLLNTYFKVNFNSTNDDELSDGTIPDAVIGFEEILDYIESENQIRELGNIDDSVSGIELTDSSNETINKEFGVSEQAKLLGTDISQARAIEYIINYKYKRIREPKKKINVLEIEPMKKQTSTTVSTVKFKEETVCCFQKGENADASKIIDGNVQTRWKNEYAKKNEHIHWFQVELEGEPLLLKGITYVPRQEVKYQVGYPTKYKIELRDSAEDEGEILDSYTGEFNPAGNYLATKDVLFERPVPQKTKYIRFYFEESYIKDDQGVAAACAEFIPIVNNQKINIDTMTSSEYVGHIDDINSKYDVIYIGDNNNKKYRNKFINGDGESMLYTHVGGTILAYSDISSSNGALVNWGNKLKYLGLLDTEYEDATGTYTAHLKGQDKTINFEKRFIPISQFTDEGAGSFKGSGNDITEQQYVELMDFVKSGYPVILGDTLVTEEGEINEETVDKSSWFYKFMKEAKTYKNVIKKKDLYDKDINIDFFANLSKPEIEFEKNGLPPEPPRAGEDAESFTEEIDGKVGYITDGKLEYTFSIKNESAISPASTTYDCQLYLDLNFDGNLSTLEEQERYIEIKDKNGQVVSQVSYGDGDLRYELKANEPYTLIRKLPEDYFKIITWKLE